MANNESDIAQLDEATISLVNIVEAYSATTKGIEAQEYTQTINGGEPRRHRED
ncbi:hypothetical protein BFJ63_vAg18797 [Fusarium oxysporum f. sp. narcissi]|uniref:Uncharacterized protein n=1 Tax=Fusarium oxysporum f. sp. narcissi TaxID=451672 RepID=A0A4Q2V153_FUSOX|nr:hypothetical protein BFJ63_vAg18797 [Fusarium oxysporum f. sp. narcissi]